MPIIYEPRGKAREYCELAVNLYHGCDHACYYCYAPKVTHKSREEFIQTRHRPGVIAGLKKDVGTNGSRPFKGREVLLCFTCDPYSTFASQSGITREAIKVLHSGGANVNILTKGGLRSMTDFGLLGKKDKYGATLTFWAERDSLKWEPGAATPAERIYALQEAYRRGITTWASLEPVIKPETTLRLIEETHEFVDIFKVGKWNHDARAKEIGWKEFALAAVALLEKYHKKYLIKKDLAAFLD